MAKTAEKKQAILLRKKGISIGDIAKQLHVSKSTASIWCRDIPLSQTAISRIGKNANSKSISGLRAYSEAKKQDRQKQTSKNTTHGAERLGTLTNRDLFCLGLGLYWGEGYKHGNREFGFTNSDPTMILFYIYWLEHMFSIEKERLILRVSINQQHAHRIDAVESYWSNLTKIPLDQFTKMSLVKTASKKRFSNHHTHYGTLRIKVRGGSDTREQVLGAIKKAAQQISDM